MIEQKNDMIGIRGKILITFTAMALVPLLVLGIFTTMSINDLGERSVDDSTSALQHQATSDLTTQTRDKAIQVEQFFADIEADAKMLMDFANDLYNHPERYENDRYPDFKYSGEFSEKTVDHLPDWGYVYESNDERNGAWSDWDGKVQTCPYLNSSVVKRAAQESDYRSWLNNEINLSVNFDHAFKPVYDNNQPQVSLVWMVRHGGITNSYSETPVDYGELLRVGDLTDDWDEDSEEYVTMASPKNNPKKELVWTDPYFDTVGNGWLVSCIGPIYQGNSFIGTVGIDVQLDMILNTVLDISMYRTGHAFLIDENTNTISHKDLEFERNLQTKEDPENTDVDIRTLETDCEEFSELLSEMFANEKGMETVSYDDGEKNYIGYTKIGGTNFVLGIVVPEEEVVESVEETEESIERTTSNTLLFIIAIDSIALCVILMVGLVLSNRIVKPINKMAKIASSIGCGELDDTLFEKGESHMDEGEAKKDEIGLLMRSFNRMMSSINEKRLKEKKLKDKEDAPIPQQLIQEIKIEIHDSVINRSNIGVMGQGGDSSGGDYCLNCGKDLPGNFKGEFCPHCGDPL